MYLAFMPTIPMPISMPLAKANASDVWFIKFAISTNRARLCVRRMLSVPSSSSHSLPRSRRTCSRMLREFLSTATLGVITRQLYGINCNENMPKPEPTAANLVTTELEAK